MAFIELRVEPHEDSWTVRHDRALFERYPEARDALNRAYRQAETLRRAGHETRVTVDERGQRTGFRFPRDREPGALPPYECRSWRSET